MIQSILVACLLQLAAARAADGHAPGHIRVVWTSDPAHAATISWTTATEGARHLVKFRAANEHEWQSTRPEQNEQFEGRLKGAATPYFHHARLTGLQPATVYHLACESDGHSSSEYHFLTAPDEDVPVAVLYGGDSRSGIADRRRVNRMIAQIVAEQSAAGRPSVLALAHGGDFIGHGRRLDQWLGWLDDYQATTTDTGRLLPIIPTRGNHDMGPLFDQVFDFPAGDGNYYAIDLAPEVRLATLNTETSTAGDQRKWLAAELAAHRSRRRWYVCQYHKPAFPAVKIPSGALTNWVPLFEKHGVDLVCEADGHVIKRTPPIKNLKVDPSGVVYIGEGGLGVGQRTPQTFRWYLTETAEHCGSGHHVHLLTFTREALNVRVIKLGGEVFDEFAIEPKTPH